MNKKNLNKLLIAGASSESDLQALANALNISIKYIGSIYNIKEPRIRNFAEGGSHPDSGPPVGGPRRAHLSEGSYIFLISPSKKITNGHWVALKVNKNKSYYFDSYGQPPPQIIVENIKTPLYYNNKQIQDLASSHCGIYCIYFLKEGPKMIKHFKIHNIY